MSDATEKVTESAEGKTYRRLTAEFTDLEGVEREESLRFSKPGRKEIVRLANAPKAKQTDTLCKVLTALVHSEDRARFEEIVRDEQLLALSFGDQLMKACGAGSVRLGN